MTVADNLSDMIEQARREAESGSTPKPHQSDGVGGRHTAVGRTEMAVQLDTVDSAVSRGAPPMLDLRNIVIPEHRPTPLEASFALSASKERVR